jgi:hypothetical protein
MIRKFFPLDRNYLLESVQEQSQEQLVQYLFQSSRDHYLTHHNPLGLEDDNIIKIKTHLFEKTELFQEFYWDLCGIHRFSKPENQLDFRFDGKTHQEVFEEEWQIQFEQWVSKFNFENGFTKIILSSTVFSSGRIKEEWLRRKLRNFVEQYFDIRIYKYKGIIPLKAPSKN